MSLGCVISTTNCQDITELGGLARSMPATSAAYLVAGAGLTGLLPFGCFWAFGLLFDSFGHSAPFFSGVVLVTNGLTLFNLTRVYRQVFLDQPHPKTRRAPEVNWLMALPMVSLLVLVLLTPLIIQRLAALQPITHLSWWALLGLWASSLVGLLAGANVSLDRFSSRSLYPPLRRLQDLLANDFYTEKIYNATIVAFVARLAWLTNSVDRLVVNRLVNLVGSMALASAASLRLGVSGQLQSYVLTVVLAIVLLLGSLTWMRS
jgi:NAD(P)H-quinone oxidoreductase subunit 5